MVSALPGRQRSGRNRPGGLLPDVRPRLLGGLAGGRNSSERPVLTYVELWSAFATLWPTIFLALLRRDSLRVGLACLAVAP